LFSKYLILELKHLKTRRIQNFEEPIANGHRLSPAFTVTVNLRIATSQSVDAGKRIGELVRVYDS
jgi:hypothetical protein